MLYLSKSMHAITSVLNRFRRRLEILGLRQEEKVDTLLHHTAREVGEERRNSLDNKYRDKVSWEESGIASVKNFRTP